MSNTAADKYLEVLRNQRNQALDHIAEQASVIAMREEKIMELQDTIKKQEASFQHQLAIEKGAVDGVIRNTIDRAHSATLIDKESEE